MDMHICILVCIGLCVYVLCRVSIIRIIISIIIIMVIVTIIIIINNIIIQRGRGREDLGQGRRRQGPQGRDPDAGGALSSSLRRMPFSIAYIDILF